MEYLLIILIFFLIFAFFSSKKNKKPPEDLFSKATSDLLINTSDTIKRSQKLLDEINAEKQLKRSFFKKYETFEITGVHIPDRKNRIIKTCLIDDQVLLSREPNNKFDLNAIVVENYKGKIGYIQSADTSYVHSILEKEHYAYISYLDNNDNYLTVEITIEF